MKSVSGMRSVTSVSLPRGMFSFSISWVVRRLSARHSWIRSMAAAIETESVPSCGVMHVTNGQLIVTAERG